MSIITIIIVAFFILGAIDKLLGDRLGFGREFEKGFMLFTPMALSMLGMLVVAPAIGVWLTPFFRWVYDTFTVDPSIIPASLFANDMGGTTLSLSVGHNTDVAPFNAYVVSSMMGTTISYTIPVALGLVSRAKHSDMFFGILCGIVTIPVGCFVSGLMCGVGVLSLLSNLLPLIVFSAVIVFSLVFARKIAIKVFVVFGQFMRCISIAGLICAAFTFLTKIEICQHFDSFENAAFICVNACVTLAGMLPFMYLLSKLLNRPIERLGAKIGVDSTSALSIFTTIVSSTPTFGLMDGMSKKGVVLNSAFAVSAAFSVGGHLAFTMAVNPDFVAPMIVGKLISGVAALGLALLLYKDSETAE